MNTPEVVEGDLKRRDGAPPFEEPWHAQVLAMADLAIKDHHFAPSAWAQALGAEINTALQSGKVDTAETFYEAALTALEQLLVSEGSITAEEIDGRAEEWELAYRRTPHGQPVVLDDLGSASVAAVERG